MALRNSINRREALQAAAASLAVVGLHHLAPGGVPCAWGDEEAAGEAPSDPETEKRFKKAVKLGMVKVNGSLTDKFKLLRELGYDGVELDSPGGPAAEEVAAAKAESRLEVHGVVDSVHWQETLSSPDEAVRQRGLEALRTALKMSKAYGGTSVLLVPGVARGGVTYDQCWERSIVEIRKALPLAEELEISILIENVWNDFLTDPKEFAKYLDEIDSPWVGAYFDVGNTVRYSPPHEWIPILGARIKKLDIKDYGHERKFGAELTEGDVDWAKVMAELRNIDYRGWATAEVAGGDRKRLAFLAERMDKIFAM